MIAFVEVEPKIEIKGEHFMVTIESGGDQNQFLLTARAFFIMQARCKEAFAKRQIADLEAQEKIIPFRKATKPKGKRGC